MVLDESADEILVVRDPFRSRIELHLRGETPDSYTMARLTPFEARRLAAILLFQAGRLERPPRFAPRRPAAAERPGGERESGGREAAALHPLPFETRAR
jgi:hypothetical protein